MSSLPFDLFLPDAATTAVVFSSPHSGRDYPAEFLERIALDGREIRSSEDAFVDTLVADAPRFGAPLIAARVPRAYVDLNRAQDELDPALIDGVVRASLNPRVTSGLGVIPRVVSNGRSIYRRRLAHAEAMDRLERCWRPYHAALAGLVDAARAGFGQAILIDWHSMPHEAITAHGRGTASAPEVVLGDRFGAAAAGWVVEGVEAAFQRAGFRVARNAPFAGAYVAQAYGRPAFGQHVVQVEVDRALYLDEARIRPAPGFDALRARLTGVIAEIALLGVPGSTALAAE
jgi:N-formylglutamate amidohydrolase